MVVLDIRGAAMGGSLPFKRQMPIWPPFRLRNVKIPGGRRIVIYAFLLIAETTTQITQDGAIKNIISSMIRHSSADNPWQPTGWESSDA